MDRDLNRTQLQRIADQDEEAELEKELNKSGNHYVPYKRKSRKVKRVVPLAEAKARLLAHLEEEGKLAKRASEE